MYQELPKNRKIITIDRYKWINSCWGYIFWNIQILNRITSFSPLIYWTLAYNLKETLG